ncbi:MAG: hypothetical protein JW889_08475 [Verrucomicrobia bacterium]|nr:hypothetical protein [Verrucomicrobiota bacterium]
MGTPPQRASFLAAKPIWPSGRERERNLFVGFRAVVEPLGDAPVILHLTAASLYRASVNGRFAGYGPARGPHGFFRVDDWDLTPHLSEGKNVIAVEVAGYSVNGFYTLDVPSFLQAEIVLGDRVVAATGRDGFEARILSERVQRVQRYSFMRAFIEAYRLTPGHDAWRASPDVEMNAVECVEQPATHGLLPRGVSYPCFDVRVPMRHISRGTLRTGVAVETLWRDRALTAIGPKLKGYTEDEVEFVLSTELQSLRNATPQAIHRVGAPADTIELETNAYHILDFGTNLTGFLGATVTCRTPARFLITFDECLVDGEVDFKRLGCVNAIQCELQPGTYGVESFEAYTLRYAKLFVPQGECVVENVHLREYTNPDVWGAQFSCSDPRLNRIFEAGRETFRQNAVDVFTDCPSRERGGYLCDSFFTARVERVLTGATRVEHAFFEDYLLPARFEFLPDGMLPMCYPADHNDGVCIPNWALWFVVQLEEYLARSGDRVMVDALRARVLRLFDYFRPFLNGDGLLENLENWVFIEWSKANEFVRDVSYPTNMLYAAARAAAGRMCGRPDLVENAAAIRRTIREQSFDGEFFVDNAVRESGVLRPTRNRTETCQYYAFFFDVADPATHAALWKTLCDEFGPNRAEGAHPDIHPSNAFIGLMLRSELLSRYGRTQQLLDEAITWLLPQAERTGTLWEHVHAEASCNHGFASHIVHTLYRDALGLSQLDTAAKRITLRFTNVALASCEGRIPTPDGDLALRWTKDGRTLTCTVEAPPGYAVDVENPDALTIVRRA